MEFDHSVKVDKKVESLKVLFLTYYYPPQKFPRAIQISHLVQYLRKDCHLNVLTSVPDGKEDPSLLNFTPLDNVIYAQKSWLTKFIEQSRGYRIKKEILPDFQYPWHFDLLRAAKQIIERSGTDIIVTFG